MKKNSNRLLRIFAVAAAALLSLSSSPAADTSRNIFVFAQIRYEGDWDPYPGMWEEIISFLTTTTSVAAARERKIIAVGEGIFQTPVVWLFGKREFAPLSDEQVKILRDFFDRGGTMFIDDSSDSVESPFRRGIQREFARIFPGKRWGRIPESHSIYRSFYLMRGPAGRVMRRDYLEGILSGSRYAAVLSSNDIGGAWQKDKFGNYLYECVPARERQRWESHKLTVNFILYSLTGTYKSDAVHQPFIERKIRR
ncbi:MAG: hypothetical protein CVU77_08765 [Elusimicrobia bacterium HGW-Elusimicrobia-1]|jgi:hypothetical protein|nr:MAG: hypothetical protein CVU77_08765 [Elusimicrobia bacterium HGW-Elusimicrobia-1]